MSVTSTDRRNRGWLWFFLILAALAAVAVSALMRYNLGQQLRLEDVREARARWQANGPRDYRLTYTMKKNNESVDRYAVHVRGGKIELATVNGKPIPAERLAQADMDGLFSLIGEHLRLRAQPDQPRTFLRARFDGADGHVRSYVRAPRGQDRLEITIESLDPLPAR